MKTALQRSGNVAVSRPNWSQRVRETIEFRTEIFESFDGSEYRFSQRQAPRMSFQYRSDAFAGLASKTLADFTTEEEDKNFAVACAWRRVRLTSDLSAGSTSITVDEEYRWWVQAGATLILESSTQTEAVLVTAVSVGAGGMTVTIDEATTYAYTGGDKLMAGVIANYPKETSLTSLVAGHLQTTPTFLADPAELPPWQLQASDRPVFKGYQVLPSRHNWAEALSVEHDDNRTLVDYGIGVQSVSWERDFIKRVENRRHVALNRELADDLVHDFIRHKGMRTPFWTTSLQARFPEGASATEGSRSLFLNVSGIFVGPYANKETFKYLYVEWPDGAVQINEVSNASSGADRDLVNVVDDWERDIDASTFVGFALFCRYGSDRLEIEWETDSVAVAYVPVKVLNPSVLEEDVVLVSTPNNVLSADVTAWTDPATYTEIDLAASGVHPEVVDGSDARMFYAFFADTEPTAPNTWETRVRFAFFDSVGTLISEDSAFQPSFKGNDTDVKGFGLEGNRSIPIGTRTVRHRISVTRDYQTPSQDFFDIVGPEFGPSPTAGNLQ